MKLRTISRGLPMPRLLPLTILTMAAVLAVKSAALVRAAVPADSPAGATQAKSPDTASPGRPVDAMPTVAMPAETKPGDARPGDPKSADAKPGEAKPSNMKADAKPEPPPISESERTLLLDLRKRRDELDARDAALATRESVLAAAEARLTTRLSELGALQKRLESLESARHDHDEANWRGLVKLYENMKPKDAGVIFNDLDMPVLLPVLDRMKEAKAAAIMAAMLPERARQVTAELAQMRSRANAVPPAAAIDPAGAKPANGG